MNLRQMEEKYIVFVTFFLEQKLFISDVLVKTQDVNVISDI